ncbi:MAG: hypothetical protein HYW63_03700 [Candidatus Levybacteria bacterium]|nr:hypothetical protein [Candidatus Levybacteria bacterium]
MNKRLIKKLAEDSYSKEKLDRRKVFAFARVLRRRDLRKYIRFLKNFEDRMTLRVTLPTETEVGRVRRRLSKIFPNKKIVFTIDPTMLAGIRVIDYDNVYELSLKNSLETALDQITSRYD